MELITSNRQGNQSDAVRNLLTVLFKHRLKIITVFCTVVGVVTTASFVVSPVYEAKSSLLVKYGREFMSQPEVGNPQPVMSYNQEEILVLPQNLWVAG